ncbi:hypothetical protein [Thermomonospora curvata]|nr:hypothetical protein [Thermomonospora curvata]
MSPAMRARSRSLACSARIRRSRSSRSARSQPLTTSFRCRRR